MEWYHEANKAVEDAPDTTLTAAMNSRAHRYWVLRTAGFKRREARHISQWYDTTLAALVVKLRANGIYEDDIRTIL